MIKVYFDWNVMAQMKNGLHPELKEIVLNNDKFLKPYSTSHISDIFSSFKEDEEQSRRINEDLDFISTLTNNHFLFNNGKDIELKDASPKEYYQQKVEEKDLFNDLSIDGLFKNFDNELIQKLIAPFLKVVKRIPLDSSFEKHLKIQKAPKF